MTPQAREVLPLAEDVHYHHQQRRQNNFMMNIVRLPLSEPDSSDKPSSQIYSVRKSSFIGYVCSLYYHSCKYSRRCL
jgi:hypothetical protein